MPRFMVLIAHMMLSLGIAVLLHAHTDHKLLYTGTTKFVSLLGNSPERLWNTVKQSTRAFSASFALDGGFNEFR